MGKAQIITDYGSGIYKIKMLYGGRTRFNNRITILTQAIADLQSRIDNETDDYKKKLLKLEKAALVKSKSYLQDNFPDDYEITVFCCDLTEGLSGNIGTIDIPGEAFEIKIQPGYTGDAGYNASRDGIIWPSVAGSADWCYFNQCILPGWQKHKPTYRIGTIIAGSINTSNHTCDVCIEAAFSSQQSLNVNMNAAIEGCPFVGHQGFSDFCDRNPAHPTCTNTDYPNPISVGSGLYSKIKEINLDVNTSHSYATDASGWRVNDYWDIMSAGESGDCEDFALTKMQELINYGVPVKNLQIATCYVEGGLGYHAVLMIQTQNRGALILDNRYDAVMDKESLEALGYKFHTYQAAGFDWASFSTKLIDVPIEYMSCNSLVFADDDEVVLKFESQNWNNPKVIGFRYNPAECDATLWWLLGAGSFITPSYGYVVEYSITADIAALGEMNDPQLHWDHQVSSAIISQYVYICGGRWTVDDDYPWANKPWDTMHRRFWCIKGSHNALNHSLQDMPGPARGHGGIGMAIDGKFYALGGKEEQAYWEYPAGTPHQDPYPHESSQKVDQYNPAADSWLNRQNIGVGRQKAGAYTLAGFGYFIGGHEAGDEVCEYYPETGYTFCSFTFKDTTNRNDQYDAAADSWIVKKSMVDERFGHFSAENEGKGMIALGGYEQASEACADWLWRDNAEIYDPETNSWLVTPRTPGWSFLYEPPPAYCSEWEYWHNPISGEMIHNGPSGAAFDNFYAVTSGPSSIIKYSNNTKVWILQSDLSGQPGIKDHSRGGVIW
jgi:predicted transglutaminase-like cysteine proteinase